MGDVPPIDEQEFRAGVTVIDFGDIRVARGLSRRSKLLECPHMDMVYDQSERRIWCRDCENDVEPFDAFRAMVEQASKFRNWALGKTKEIAEANGHALISRASKVVDAAWRSRRLSPCCPHCGDVLLPEDFADGIYSSASTELERQRRRAQKDTKGSGR